MRTGEGAAPVDVVMITHERVRECTDSVARLRALGEARRIIVVDNASTDGTADELRRRFPDVVVVRSQENLGAAARNVGADLATSPYVAFCDDDCVWCPGSLTLASTLLDAHPSVAGVCARVVVGDDARLDPTSAVMAASPLASDEPLPGPPLLGLLAGASVLRRGAFVDCGGYEPRLFLGGEEELLALDLVHRGWWLAYVDDLVVHHRPSSTRDRSRRDRLSTRNRLWTTWLRFPLDLAMRRTLHVLREAWTTPAGRRGVFDALRHGAWVVTEREPVDRRLARSMLLLDATSRSASEVRRG